MLVTTRAAAPRSGLTSTSLSGPAAWGPAASRFGVGVWMRCGPSGRLGGGRCLGRGPAGAVGLLPAAAVGGSCLGGSVLRLLGGGRGRRRRAARRGSGAPRCRPALGALGGGGPRCWPASGVAPMVPALTRPVVLEELPPGRSTAACPSGTAGTARPRATRSVRRRPGGRCWRTGRARRMRLFLARRCRADSMHPAYAAARPARRVRAVVASRGRPLSAPSADVARIVLPRCRTRRATAA